MSAELQTLEAPKTTHGRLCFCELCVPAWGALNVLPPPTQPTGDDDDDGVGISLTEWAERGFEGVRR